MEGLKILRNNQISLDRWTSFISEANCISVFQTPEFYSLFNSIPGLSADVLAVDEKSVIKAICVVTNQKETGIKSVFSRRAIIYGGPGLKDEEDKCFHFLLESINNEFKKKSIYLEIRCLNDYSLFNSWLIKRKWNYLPYQNYLVDCRNNDLLFQKLSSNRKRQIKKAVAAGVKIKEAGSIEDVEMFYSILHQLYTKKVKKPLLPKSFFIEFFKRKGGKYFLVMFNNVVIGGIMCPILQNRCIYELYVCGLDEIYRDQSPSVMATWAAMEYATKTNIPVFDFMGAGLKTSSYGVKDFKARFGGELVEYGRYLRINKPLLYFIGKIGLKILSYFRL